MASITKQFSYKNFFARFSPALLAVATVLGSFSAAQSETKSPPAAEGCLLYRSPVSGLELSVPLVHTDASLDVRGLVASATVTQQFVNSSNTPIEAVYTFPLPHDAGVYDLEIHIGDRVIRSEIHERAEAKRIYDAAKSEGKRSALVEEERPNIFTASIANIMPNDHISVRLRYVEPLRWEDGKMRVVFPMVVGPRYIPGTQAIDHTGTGWAQDTNSVPDASRITPVVRNPDSRPGHDISVSVDLDPGFAAATVNSVSHEINVHRAPDGRQHVELATVVTLPNKDFILEVQQRESTEATAALFLSPSDDSAETHFLLAAFPPSVQPTKRLPVEMLYMIDVSGSMTGTSITQARTALLEALDRLQPLDRFGILQFSSDFHEFAPTTLPATPENLAAAREYVNTLRAGGGTEMLPALLHLMRKPEVPGYMRHIILLTDGDLGNEEQIFSALRASLGGARLYTVAIGSEPNLWLAAKMAQFGRGTLTHIADIHEIEPQMSHLFECIESPVLTDVKVTFEGVEVADVYPERAPDLFLRQPLLLYGRITKGHAGKVHLTGRAGNENYETTVAFDASAATFHPGITTLWARQKVEELMDRWRQSDENEQTSLRAGIIAHAIRYRLVTRFTSLVAVEQIVVNPNGQSSTIPVPTEFPAGWQMEGVFGAPATGTADAFLEVVGVLLLSAGSVLLYLFRRQRLLLRKAGAQVVNARTRIAAWGSCLGRGGFAFAGARSSPGPQPVGLLARCKPRTGLGSRTTATSRRPDNVSRLALALPLFAALLLLAGISLTARAAYLHLKASLARRLIRHAWEQTVRDGQARAPWPWADTHPIARLEIPRIGYDEIVLDSATPRTLAFGPALLQSGARPGRPGNVVLAGHRTSWFLPLENIQPGDEIELEWFDTRHNASYQRSYKVDAIRVVLPDDLSLLGPTPRDALTLLTCYPFGRGPSSPQRFLVRATPQTPSHAAAGSRASAKP